MKRFILFLDFDGVLCTSRQAYAVGDRGLLGCLDPVSLDFLDRLCREYKIWVIISSTWRIGERVEMFINMFKATGHFDLAKSLFYDDYATRSMNGRQVRGLEIEDWMKRHDDLVLDYLIIDDDFDMLDYQMSRLVNTPTQDGMLLEHYVHIEKVIENAFAVDNDDW